MKAVVTGATKGIGRAIAFALADKGYDLAVCARTEHDLLALKSSLLDLHPDMQVLIRSCDVGVKDEVYGFAEYIADHWDSLDVLVNNAGIFIPGKVTVQQDEDFERVISVNFYSAYYMTRGLLPLLEVSDQAYIINMSSIAALGAYENGGAYGIAKAALLSLSRTLRAELKKDGIKVTAILAGATYTDSWAQSGLPEERFMQPGDVANAVMTALTMSKSADLEEVILRPQLGDI